MQQYRNLILGFAFIIVLLSCLASLSLYHLKAISEDVDNIYNHPFAVSNAGRSIQSTIYAMHRDMKDVVLVEGDEQLDSILSQINQRELTALRHFDTIFERFLGDKDKLKQTYQLFIEWKTIRDEVVRLKRAGEINNAAQITRGRGAQHIELLLSEVNQFVEFAHNKAEQFQQKSAASRDQSILIVSLISAITFLFSVLIALSVIRKIKNSESMIAQREHLVDQNIMIATLDPKGVVIDASNALCRFIGTTKPNVIGKPSFFFDNSDEQDELIPQIWNTVKTGKAWHGEVKRISSDGLVYWAESTVMPNMDESFHITGYTNLLQDTTSKKLSITDKLTTLPNRRSFDEIFDRELRLAKRHGSPLTVAIIDVDYFKRYNDELGHPQGDKVLRKVATGILDCLHRPTDYAFRIGGEEFALIISGQERHQSQEFLDKIRNHIVDLQIPHPGNDISEFLTISIGAYWFEGSGDLDKNQIYSEADKALYLAKTNRNNMVLHSCYVKEVA